jgi:hypothetical protein
MALGDNTAFFNETTFLLGDQQSGTTGISGTAITAVGGGAIDSPAAKVLFTLKDPLLGEAGPFTALINDDVRNLSFGVSFYARYIGETISVITADRLAIQGTLTQATTGGEIVALSAKGHNSVGPTLRRLYQLGYV